MIKVEMILQDTVEIGAFHQFASAIERYRVQAFQNQATPAPAPAAEPVAEAAYEKQDPAVVGAITPAGPVAPPKEEALNAAAQAYMNLHGLDKALAVVREFGVQRISELKDPAMRAALYQRLVKDLPK